MKILMSDKTLRHAVAVGLEWDPQVDPTIILTGIVEIGVGVSLWSRR